jgi:hypothetical protein
LSCIVMDEYSRQPFRIGATKEGLISSAFHDSHVDTLMHSHPLQKTLTIGKNGRLARSEQAMGGAGGLVVNQALAADPDARRTEELPPNPR